MAFPQFTLLPPEIQLKIWVCCLPSPRIVDLFAVPINDCLQPQPQFETSATNTNATSSTSNSTSSLIPNADEGPPAASLVTKQALTTVWVRTFIERIYSTPHSLSCLHICSEARRVALKKYVKLNADVHMDFRGDMELVLAPFSSSFSDPEAQYCLSTLKGSRSYALFDPSHDILFLQDPPRTVDRTGGLVISSLEILSRWCPVDKARLKRLALPYYTWRKTRNNGRLRLLREFGLEDLVVSFLGDGYSGSHRASWSDVVGGLWSHVKEVEDEVRADVESLKKQDPSWTAPRLRIVRHRGVLLQELEGR